VDFTIVGDITDIETFAVGKAIREIGRREDDTDVGDGGSARGLPMWDCPMVVFAWRSCIGTRPEASGRRSSRSSGTWS